MTFKLNITKYIPLKLYYVVMIVYFISGGAKIDKLFKSPV